MLSLADASYSYHNRHTFLFLLFAFILFSDCRLVGLETSKVADRHARWGVKVKGKRGGK